MSTVLMYRCGDFNTYAFIDGRDYVAARPGSGLRLVYSAGLGMLWGGICGISVWIVGRHGLMRFVALSIVFTTAFFTVADLNWYVIGYGPEGQDWVKNDSVWGTARLVECGVLGMFASGFACFVLWVVAPANPGSTSNAKS